MSRMRNLISCLSVLVMTLLSTSLLYGQADLHFSGVDAYSEPNTLGEYLNLSFEVTNVGSDFQPGGSPSVDVYYDIDGSGTLTPGDFLIVQENLPATILNGQSIQFSEQYILPTSIATCPLLLLIEDSVGTFGYAIVSVPYLNAGKDVVLCDNESGQIGFGDGVNGYTYLWSAIGIADINALSEIDIANPTVSAVNLTDQQIEWQFVLTTEKGSGSCIFNDTVSVFICPTQIETVCSGENFTFSVSATDYDLINWIGPNGFISDQSNPTLSNVQLADTGVYKAVTYFNGCVQAKGCFRLRMNETPLTPQPSANGPFCVSSTDTLKLFANATADEYEWTGPNQFTSDQQNPIIVGVGLANAGTYQLVLKSNGCSSDPGTVNVVVGNCSIDIEKHTNGQDADVAPGPIILVDLDGEIVTWTYIVTNTGSLDLENVQVTDDKEGLIGTIPFLAAGATETLTLTGDAIRMMYANLATVVGQPVDDNGTPVGPTVTDEDPSHYTGVFINVEKRADKDTICPGEEVIYNLIVRMLGGAPGIQIRDISIVDNNLPDTLDVTSPFFVGTDANNNGYIDFMDEDSNGVNDEEFLFEYGLFLTEDNINIARDRGEVWYVDPGTGDEFFVGVVGNRDTVSVAIQVDSSRCKDIGDYVWYDVDRDGIQDASEVGIKGVTVYLLNENGDTLRTTTTDADGFYLFPSVRGGTYQIIFDISTNTQGLPYAITSKDQGGDDNLDSDANPNGFTDLFQHLPATVGDRLDIDAGLYLVANIGDFVFEDTDRDGIQDAGETGIEGVTVYLIDVLSGDTVDTDVTDANGAYLFEDVNGGDYIIAFDPTTNTTGQTFSFSPQDQGGNDDLDSDPNPNGIVFITFDPTQGDDLSIDAGLICTRDRVTVNLTTCIADEAGTTVDTFTSAAGCDSIVTTITTLLPPATSSVEATTCDPQQVGTTVDTIYGGAANGCDSIITTVTTLVPEVTNTVNLTTCIADEAGTTVDTFTSAAGCDSIVTTITTLLPPATSSVEATTCDPQQVGTTVDTIYGGAANGCDSIITTVTTLVPEVTNTVNLTTCIADEAGTTVDTFTSAAGCDSIVTTITTLLPPSTSSVEATTCDPQQVGTTVDTIYGGAENGCDSIITTVTTLVPEVTNTVNLTTCIADEAGTTVDTFTSAAGCDSIVTTITTLLPPATSSVEATTCDPQQVGTSVDTIYGGAANGCDSIITTVTTLVPEVTNTVNLTTCIADEAGTTVDTFTSAAGCDSIVTTITTLLPPATSSVEATTCDPQQVGTTVDTIYGGAVNGCDSIITTVTTLLESIEVTLTPTVCDESQTEVTVDTFTASNGCDSIVITIPTYLPPATSSVESTTCDPLLVGTTVDTIYGGAANGCDSIITTVTTLLPSFADSLEEVTCDPEQVGTFTETFVASNGCDSVVTTTYTLSDDYVDLPNDTIYVACDPSTNTGEYCLPIKFTDFNGYDLLIDGEVYFDQPFICDLDSLGGYDFSTVIQSNPPTYGGGTYILLSWTINGVEQVPTNFTYNTFSELAAYMSSKDPAGLWTAVGDDRIEGGFPNTNFVYGTLDVFSPLIGAQAFVNYNSGIVSNGTLIEDITPGCHWFTLTSVDNPECTDSVLVCVECCEPTNETVNLTTCIAYEAGTTVDTFTSAAGCDSIVTTITTLLPPATSSVEATTCDPQQVGTTVDTIYGGAANGCDSIITTVTTLVPEVTNTVNLTTCIADEAGTTVDTFTSAAGCDSIVTTITTLLPPATSSVEATTCDPQQVGTTVDTIYGGAANGCDSIITTVTTLVPEVTNTVNLTTCIADEAGTAVDTFTSAAGCDSIVTTITTLLPPATSSVEATTCDPQQVGTTVDTIYGGAANGCDSIITTVTTLVPEVTNTVNLTTCIAEEAGTTVDTFTSAAGCDSIVTTITTLLPPATSSVEATTCDPQQVGTTVDTIYGGAANGCDSIITTVTTLVPEVTNTINLTTCIADEAGTTIDTFTSAAGCDSIVTTITTLLPPSTSSVEATTCDPQQVGTTVDTIYGGAANGCDSIITTVTTLVPEVTNTVNLTTCITDEAGTTVDTFTSTAGCDSIVTTITTLLPPATSSVEATTCDPQQVGTTVDTIYGGAANGCDSIITTVTTLLESIEVTLTPIVCDESQTEITVDTFTSSNGCDSIVTTIPTYLPPATSTVESTTCDPQQVGTTVDTIYGGAANGCDSIVTVINTLLPSYEITVTDTVCNPADTGIVVENLTTIGGCDSIVTSINVLVPGYIELPDSVTVQCTDQEAQTGEYCVPIPLADFINGYDLLIDGEVYFDLPFVCDLDSIGGYDFTTVINSNPPTYGGGTYILISWKINGVEQVPSNFTYNTFDELAAYMLSKDPAGQWFADDDRIEGGFPHTSSIYGTLNIFSPLIGAQSFTNYNSGVVSKGTLIEDIPVGCHWLTIVNLEHPSCTDSIYVCVECPIVEIDTIPITWPNDEDSIVLCLDPEYPDALEIDLPVDTAYVCGQGIDITVTVDPNSTCVTLVETGNLEQNETDEVCVIHCTDGLCDTTIIIIIPEPVSPDTLYISVPVNESSDELCPTGDQIGTVVTVEDLGCDVILLEGSTIGTTTAGCVIYNAGNTVGNYADTICLVGIDVNGNPDTTVFIVSVIPVTDTIPVPDDTLLCLDPVVTVGGPVDTVYSCDGSEIDVVIDSNQCEVAINIPPSLDGNPYEICVVTCSEDICDTTIIIVTPEIETDTLYISVPVNESSDELCPTGDQIGTVVTVEDLGCDVILLDGSSIETTTAGCVIYNAGNTVGNYADTICLVGIDVNGNPDTTVFIVSVIPVTDTIPVPDDTLLCLDPVVTVGGPVDTVYSCDGSEIDVVIDSNQCEVAINIPPSLDGNPYEICVVTCSEDICDTTIIIVTPEIETDTLYISVPVNESSDELCPTGDQIGTVVTVEDLGCDVILLDGSTIGTTTAGCVIYNAGNTVGNYADTICLVGIDVNGNPDTTVFIVSVIPVTDTIPVPDDTLLCLDPVVTVGGPVDTVYSCDGSEIDVVIDSNQCEVAINIPPSLDGNPYEICVVTCSEDICDTTIIIVTPEIETDTLYISVPVNESSDELCPTGDQIGTVVTVEDLGCDVILLDGSTIGTTAAGCVIYNAGNTVGNYADTICLVGIDVNGNPDTTVFIVSVIPVTDTIPVPDDTLLCLDPVVTVGGPVDTVYSCDGSEIDVVIDSNQCEVAINIPPSLDGNPYEICVVTCSEDICDTTIIIVTPEIETDTLYISVPVNESSDELCPTGDQIGTVVTVEDLGCDVILLDGSTIGTTAAGCVIYNAGNTVGNYADTICLVGIDVNGNPDTTVFIVSVIPVTDTIPVPDDTLLCLDPVVTVGGPVDTIYSCDGSTIIIDTTSEQCGVLIDIPVSQDPNQIDTICVITCSGVICDTTIIIVTPTGHPPIAVDDFDTTSIDVPVVVSVLDNDFDPDNDSIVVISVITDPQNGTVTVDQTNGTITYDPSSGYVGVDSFQYVICDIPLDGCDSAWVYISIKDEECLFPQAITPNGDGDNDVFDIRCLFGQEKVTLNIFNRWGNEVYHNNNYQNDWDGTYKTEPLPDGAYYYVIEFNDVNSGERTQRGGYIMIHR